jgi:starch-binding outer membrane protein, SusD/RagB family
MRNIIKTYSKLIIMTVMVFLGSACGKDFLNRPPEDSYTTDSFYTTDEQLYESANPLYGGVWFDYQRAFLAIGDAMAGNSNKGGTDPFFSFSVNGSTTDLLNASNSAWTAVAYCNSVIENVSVKAGPNCSAAVKNAVIGEAMVWKGMAYFYLVRMFHNVPIIHSNSKLIDAGTASKVMKNPASDVYEYIVRTLTGAADLLPASGLPGRINKWTAYGLLAKVYLARSGLGQSGTRNQADLDNAKLYAGKVIFESGLSLTANYADLFTISKGNRNPENLLSWHWVVAPDWGPQNALQADLAVQNFTGHGDGWGTWSGPSIDLENAFGEDAKSKTRQNIDVRRKATMMMFSDLYLNWWRNKGGFTCTYDNESVFASPTGAFAVKHIVGSKEDHMAETGGIPSDFMKTSLSTHLLRLADVYLVYAESFLPTVTSETSDAAALNAYNAVRTRAIKSWVPATSIKFMDVFKERRLELAYEGDNWYDYVRLHYFEPQMAINLLGDQERGSYGGLTAFYKDPANVVTFSSQKFIPTDNTFILPFPEVDVSINPNLLKDPVPFDFSTLNN